MSRPRNDNYNRGFEAPKEYEDKVLQIKRTSKKTTGGNTISFSALVVIGNKKGKIGTGLGKGLDVSSAVQKALSNARKNLIDIKFTGSTIAYEVSEKYGSAKVLLKPAPEGSGIVAGGAVRSIVELAGIKDITGKMLGSNNKICNVLCTLDALKKLRV
jgi:small subunit ribosomal protein S5